MEMPLDRIIDAERRVEIKERPTIVDNETMGMGDICQAAAKQLFQLVEWAKHVPHFNELCLPDRVTILRGGVYIYTYYRYYYLNKPYYIELSQYIYCSIINFAIFFILGWNELLIAGVAHRSMEIKDSLILANGLTVQRNTPGLVRVHVEYAISLNL